MRKELLWAGIIGIIFGIAIGFGAWRVRNKSQNDGNPTPQPSAQSGTGNTKIALDKPENLRVFMENPVAVSGLTKALNWVIISAGNKDYIAESSDDGTFLVDTDLEAGVNHIQASSINADGSLATQKVLVVYSESFKPDGVTLNQASSESKMQDSVALKLAQSENPPRAYIGTVTDIAETTIQIRSTDSQIEQISATGESIDVLNTKGTSNKSVKFADIAIGDFIVAMGYLDGNDVLDAKRILISDVPNDPKLDISLYKVKNVGKKSLDLVSVARSEDSSLTPDKNTVILSFDEGKVKKIALADISPDQLIIVVAEKTGSPSLIRTVFAISSK